MSTLILGLAVVVGAPTLKEKPPAISLSGEWVVAGYIIGGNAAEPGVHIQFAADGTATFSGGPPKTTTVGKYTFNSKKDPAEVDILFPDSNAGAMIGIVKIVGDGLELCFGPAGERPTKFEAPAGTAIGLLTLKRVKKD